MGVAVVTVAAGGLPVVDVTATKPALGLPVTEAVNGRGIAVTKVSLAVGGLPVTFVATGNEWPSGGGTTYATWDAATVTAVTLSGGDLVATNTGTTSTDQGARVAAASGKTSGKYYFEATWTTVTSGNSANSGIGVGTTASTYTGMGPNATTGVIGYRGGSIYANGSNTGVSSGTVMVAGVTMGIAVDLDNRKMWFRQSAAGNWNSNATYNPATNVGGVTIPAGTMVPFTTFGGTGGAASNVHTANFGATAFSGAVPAGFTSGWSA